MYICRKRSRWVISQGNIQLAVLARDHPQCEYVKRRPWVGGEAAICWFFFCSSYIRTFYATTHFGRSCIFALEMRGIISDANTNAVGFSFLQGNRRGDHVQRDLYIHMGNEGGGSCAGSSLVQLHNSPSWQGMIPPCECSNVALTFGRRLVFDCFLLFWPHPNTASDHSLLKDWYICMG